MTNKSKIGIISAFFTMVLEFTLSVLFGILLLPLMLMLFIGLFIFLICIPPVLAIVIVAMFIGFGIFSILPEKWKIKLYNKYKGKF